jgi:hypothetical protein
MTKTPLQALSTLLFGLGALSAAASPLSVEAGLSYAHVSGLYSPTAEYRPLAKDKSDFAVPEIGLRYQLGESWAAGLGYAHYSGIRSEGLTIYPILDPSDQPTGFVYPARGEQRLDEFTAKLLYGYQASPRLRLEAGPVLSLLSSRYTYELPEMYAFTLLPASDMKVRETDLRLGALAGIRFELSERLSLSANYRYSAPVGHDVHLLGLTLGYRL